MSTRRACLCLFVAASLTVAAGAAVQSTETTFSDPVTALALCVPFTVLIEPSASENTSVRVSDNLVGVLGAQIINGALEITLSKAATLDTVIQVIIQVPNKDSLSLSLFGVAGAVVRGFAWTSFDASLAGACHLLAANITADSLGLSLAGAVDADVDGEFGTVTLTNEGVATAVVRGVTESASLRLMGAGSVLIAPTSDAATIDATVLGPGTVEYTQGKCTTSGMGPATPECQLTTEVPEQSTPAWSCGYQLTGTPSDSCTPDTNDLFNSRRLRLRKLAQDSEDTGLNDVTISCASSDSELSLPD
ncbi:hypothetical protein ABPG77_009325 [Micractinium sp. CCAP 211/92]